jgi:hypothetical protein
MNQMRMSVSKITIPPPSQILDPFRRVVHIFTVSPHAKGGQSGQVVIRRRWGGLVRALVERTSQISRQTFFLGNLPQSYLNDIGNGEALGVQHRRRFRLNPLVNLYGQGRHVNPSLLFKYNPILPSRQKGKL